MTRRRNPARWLAPLALVACAVAVYSLVNDTFRSDESSRPAASTAATGRSAEGATRNASVKRRGTRHKRTYRVKPGDTLSEIAFKTGVSLQQIQRLNPALDSQSLQTGEKIKLLP
jgi:LysM repeat protein